MNVLFTTNLILDGYEKSPMHSLPSPVSLPATSTDDNRIASIKFMSPRLTLRPILAKRRCKSDLTRTKSALAVRVRNIDSSPSALLCCLCI